MQQGSAAGNNATTAALKNVLPCLLAVLQRINCLVEGLTINGISSSATIPVVTNGNAAIATEVA